MVRGAPAPIVSAPRVVRVRPDEPGLDKLFDYSVPDAMADQIRVGTVVRVLLAGRRVRGWVVADHVDPPEGVTLAPVAKVTGWGPPAELLDLADWAAWRWAGRPASLLRTASAAHAVRALPTVARLSVPLPAPVATEEVHDLAAEALAAGRATVRLPPAADPYPIVVAAAALGPTLVVGPVANTVRRLGLRLRRAGLPVALMGDDWATARAGAANVFGTRATAWAPIATPAAVVILDEHDQSAPAGAGPHLARPGGAHRAGAPLGGAIGDGHTHAVARSAGRRSAADALPRRRAGGLASHRGRRPAQRSPRVGAVQRTAGSRAA